ncbi:MAG: GAF domain-containing protein, partial [Pseudomonadota bacterium]
DLKKIKEDLRTDLISKGRTLVINNSQALIGMVDDNAFSAIGDLVRMTVNEDSDIEFGMYVDAELTPWVNVSPNNPSGEVAPGIRLQENISFWLSSLTEFSVKVHTIDSKEVYEFAAPVVIDDEIMGFVRYTFSTDGMRLRLQQESDEARKKLLKSLSLFIALGIATVSLGIFLMRSIAGRIAEPLNALTASAEAIAEGDYETSVSVITNDEVGILAKTFDGMRKTINRKVLDLSILNQTGERLANVESQDAAIDIVLKLIEDHFKIRCGSIYLIDDEKHFYLKDFYPKYKNEDELEPPAKTFNLGEGILGCAIESKKATYVADTSNDPNFSNSNSVIDAKSLLCVPLIYQETVVGAINLSDEVDASSLKKIDHGFVESVARLLTISLKKIQLRQIIEEHNRTLEQKVADRTLALQKKTNDIVNMLQNMGQGLFTITVDGTIHHEYAAHTTTILEKDQIAGVDFMDLLFSQTTLGSDSLAQIEAAVFSILDAETLMFEFNAHLLPREIVLVMENTSQQKILELDWSPIVYEDSVDKLMVTMRDVTSLRSLQEEAKHQRQELAIIGQLLAVEAQVFQNFITSAHGFVEQSHTIVRETHERSDTAINSILRNLHTLKGNARTYGLSYITDCVHELESDYHRIRDNQQACWESKILAADLEGLQQIVTRYDTINQTKLQRNKIEKQPKVDSATVLQTIESIELENLNQTTAGQLANLYFDLLAFEAKTLTTIIADLPQSMASIAEKLDKPLPTIKFSGENLYIKYPLHDTLRHIFTHVLRNAIDHGIETPEERQDHNKPTAGTITIHLSRTPKHWVIAIADDGRGLSMQQLLEKARTMGITSEHDQLNHQDTANLIFFPGLSTAKTVSLVSGRGVGMDAIKTFAEEHGGQVELVLAEQGQEKSYQQFTLKLFFPLDYLLSTPKNLQALATI